MTDGAATSRDTTDIRRDDWAARHAPVALLPYIRLARLDRPIGTWLLLFPGWWAIALAAPGGSNGGWPGRRLIALFPPRAGAVRGARLPPHDIGDRDFHARVPPTPPRPVPRGALRPAPA